MDSYIFFNKITRGEKNYDTDDKQITFDDLKLSEPEADFLILYNH